MKLTPVRLGIAVLAGLLLFAGWKLYDLGKIHGVSELAGLRVEMQQLERRNKENVNESRELRDSVTSSRQLRLNSRTATKNSSVRIPSPRNDV